jgi:hypothetical protein
LESVDGNFQSNLTIVNGMLINTYVLSVNMGSGGDRNFTGRILNRCLVDLQHDLTFSPSNGSFTNFAILEIATGKRMILSGPPVFNQNRGEIRGDGVLTLSQAATLNFNRGATRGANPPTLTISYLNFGPAPTGVATFIMQGRSPTGQLSGDIGAEQTVWLRGNDQGGQTNIGANGFTNAGVIRLESQDIPWGVGLTIHSGVLTNTGVINVNKGTEGGRTITGTLVTHGEVNVDLATAQLFNGVFRVFSIGGNFTTNGILGISLGPKSNECSKLQVSGAANLNGTLKLSAYPKTCINSVI